MTKDVFFIEGVLKTVSPLHITSAISEARYSPASGKISYGSEKIGGSFPLTLTQTMRFLFSDVMSEDERNLLEEAGQGIPAEKTMQATYPIISGSTIRGMLRRGAAQVVEDHLINERGMKPSYELFQGLNTGAVSGKPDGVPPNTSEIRAAREHVFYGLFGGGPRMLRGSLVVENGLPVIDKLIDADIISPYYSDNALKGLHNLNLTEIKQVLRKDAFIGSAEDAERASEVVNDFDAEYSARHQEMVEKAINKAKGNDADGERSGTKAMSFRQDVTVGVPFLLSLQVKGTEAQVGMILAALDNMLDKGIGGKASSGFGKLTGKLTVRSRNNPERSVVADVRSGMVDFTEAAEPYLSAMSEAVSELDYDNVASFMAPLEKPATKSKKAKAEA